MISAAYFICAINMSQSVKNYGITSPISTAGPTEEDKICTKSLQEVIEPFGVFESREEVDKRLFVLGKLNTLVKEFVCKVSKNKVYIFLGLLM